MSLYLIFSLLSSCLVMSSNRPLLESNGSSTRFDTSKNMENQRRKKVLVVGAGAAGVLQV